MFWLILYAFGTFPAFIFMCWLDVKLYPGTEASGFPYFVAFTWPVSVPTMIIGLLIGYVVKNSKIPNLERWVRSWFEKE